MSRRHRHSEQGFTLLEVSLVVGIMGVLAAMAWPLTSDLIDRAALATTTDSLKSDIRKAQREARTTGRVLELRVDPLAGVYVIGPIGGSGRLSRLPTGLTFGSPDNANSDGVTFRDNTARFSPRPGLQNSFGSITVRSHDRARRITVSITGHTAIAMWNGRGWQ
jgi:prepilin-type N-terminal cleavage/methylation domain-containing protein